LAARAGPRQRWTDGRAHAVQPAIDLSLAKYLASATWNGSELAGGVCGPARNPPRSRTNDGTSTTGASAGQVWLLIARSY